MATNKWLDRTQPQTLYIATLIMYINAAFGLLALLSGLATVLEAAFIVGSVAAGWGIANEKKALYWLGIGIAALPLVQIALGQVSASLINLLFEVALVALLLHPVSRSYYRTWFR